MDAVWDKLGGVGDKKRDNGSVIGPVLTHAAELGIIVNTGMYLRSQRGHAHSRPVTLWKAA